jgi:uncharacterized peroxidase-related enzyme
MSWLRTVPYGEAEGRLKQLYDRIKGPADNVDNIMMLHSLRPHTLEGHMAIYKAALHHSGNRVAEWFLETIGVWVSLLNGCEYCVAHHRQGLARLVADAARAEAICAALRREDIAGGPFDEKEKAALRYAETLTRAPARVTEAMVAGLRELGYEDGEILEINQAAAYFAYANRTVSGLGGTTEGDVLGLSPGNAADPQDWTHR